MQTRFRFRVLSAFGALVTALLLVVPGLGAQQGGTVTGRIIDAATLEPIAAVQVFISGFYRTPHHLRVHREGSAKSWAPRMPV